MRTRLFLDISVGSLSSINLLDVANRTIIVSELYHRKLAIYDFNFTNTVYTHLYSISFGHKQCRYYCLDFSVKTVHDFLINAIITVTFTDYILLSFRPKARVYFQTESMCLTTNPLAPPLAISSQNLGTKMAAGELPVLLLPVPLLLQLRLLYKPY